LKVFTTAHKQQPASTLFSFELCFKNLTFAFALHFRFQDYFLLLLFSLWVYWMLSLFNCILTAEVCVIGTWNKPFLLWECLQNSNAERCFTDVTFNQ